MDGGGRCRGGQLLPRGQFQLFAPYSYVACHQQTEEGCKQGCLAQGVNGFHFSAMPAEQPHQQAPDQPGADAKSQQVGKPALIVGWLDRVTEPAQQSEQERSVMGLPYALAGKLLMGGGQLLFECHGVSLGEYVWRHTMPDGGHSTHKPDG